MVALLIRVGFGRSQHLHLDTPKHLLVIDHGDDQAAFDETAGAESILGPLSRDKRPYKLIDELGFLIIERNLEGFGHANNLHNIEAPVWPS